MAALLAKARVLLAALSMGKAALVDVKSVLAASLVVLAREVSVWVGRRRLVLILAAEMDWEETVYDIRSDVGTDREF